MGPVQAKLEVLENIRLLKGRVEGSSQKTKEQYERYISKIVRQRPVFRTGDWVYESKPPALKKAETSTVTHDPWQKLVTRKNGPFTALQEGNDTVAVDLDGVENNVYIDRTTLAKTSRNSTSDGEEERQEDTKATK